MSSVDESGSVQRLNVETKHVVFHPDFLVPAINPRDLSDLQGETLYPAIEATGGKITTALVVWKPVNDQGEFDPDHPIWTSGNIHDTLTGKVLVIPHGERHKYRILVQGHRRHWCARKALSQPDVCPAEMIKNLTKLPCNEITCTQEVAERLALDFETSEPMHNWNVIKLIFGFMMKDIKYTEIALLMPRMLFRALLNDGEAKYNKLLREAKSGRDRVAAIKSALKNRLDQHTYSCYLFGPAMQKQLLLYWRYVKNELQDIGDRYLLVMDMKYELVQKLRTLYNEEVKVHGWAPITRVEIVDAKPNDSQNVSYAQTPGNTSVQGRWFVIEGGSENFRQAMLKNMLVYAKPEAAEEEKKPPTQQERKAIINSTASGIGKAFSKFYDESFTEETSGKYLDAPRLRVQWEEWALFSESTQKAMLDFADQCDPLVKELLVAATSQAAPGAAAERVKTAIATLNEALKPVTVVSKKK